MAKITLEQADTIINAALAKGKEAGMSPLSVAVLDDGGNIVAFKKSDNSSVLRFNIALGKASAAIGMHRPSRALEQVAKDRPHFAEALTAASGGKFVPVAGGSLIKDGDGTVIGSVGVTGDTSDNDEIAGLAGIAAAGLQGE